MEQDPGAWIGALRRGHDRLAGFVAGASPEALGHPSMCSEWTVAQVLGHLGSGAAIGLATVTHAAVENQDVWDRWNAMAPGDTASSFVDADERLVGWYEALSDDELATTRVKLAFLPEPIDVAASAGFRLSEVALHSWDVFAAFDRAETLDPGAAALLVDRLPMMVGFVGRFTPRETRPAETATIAVTTSAPERHFELELGDTLDLRPADRAAGADGGELALPAEALLRLAAGRLHPDRQNGATITGALTLDQLRTAFPGY
jgi:uncharacterized protein (TIGR03083 family)